MPTEPSKTDTKKTAEKTEEKKPGEASVNFLKVDHSLRPTGWHCAEQSEYK
jgi:hypothetical protein